MLPSARSCRALPGTLLALAALIAGCATVPPGAAPAKEAAPVASSASAPAASTAMAPSRPASGAMPTPPTPAPGTPQPFATVIKDAKRIEGGPLVFWQRDERFWIELLPEQLGKPFLLSPKIRSGIGEAFVFGGLMAYPVNGAGGQQVVEFQRVYNQVRLLARNHEVAAKAGTPEARALETAYSPSLLGATAVASQPHPERKSILIDANALFLTDMLGVGITLQRAFRQGYGLEPRNTVITAVRTSPEVVVVETQNHYYSASIALPPPGAPTTGPTPSLPSYLPDSRSLFVSHHYSLAPLPTEPMPVRRADPRVGLFTNTVLDFSDDMARTPRQRIVNRWRLEKKDPAAALSEPVKPITFWIDRNVPLKYRNTVSEAILEWNRAFERIGFKDAIVVRQQPDDASFDTLDFGIASVRWMMNAEPSFGAIGPRHVDPRSGEILDADIAFESLSSRSLRTLRSQILAPSLGVDAERPGSETRRGHDNCSYGDHAAEQLGYALDVLEARGEVEPESDEAQQFVLDYIKATTLHEVGHALGLRHNFRASRAYTEAQLSDPEFTRANGTTASVMEYQAINLARAGERTGTAFQLTLGPYDYWAIEYAYRPFAPGVPAAQQEAELLRIAARNHEPMLAFGTDEDSAYGIDAETIQLDLGSDAIAFASKRLDIAHDLFARQETRALRPDRDYSVLRRSLNYAINDVARAVGVLTRQIGGLRTLRDFPGSGRDPLEPVPAAAQRQALDLIARSVLAADGLQVSPALQRRLAPDYLDRAEVPSVPTDFPVPQRLFELQRSVLGQLMSETVAARVLDGQGKARNASERFPLSELYDRLTLDVWSELGSAPDIAPARRDLQREFVNRIAASLLRPQARADARALLRVQAQMLLARLDAVARKPARVMSRETLAHLQDSADSLREALNARIQRSGV